MAGSARCPERRCIACGRRGPQASFERLRVAEDAEPPRVRFDEPGEPRRGRGAYVCPAQACLDRALKKRAFGRAFRRAVVMDEGELRTELLKRIDARWTRGSSGR